jgi:hypothetical protein
MRGDRADRLMHELAAVPLVGTAAGRTWTERRTTQR